jgi:hypothetical protein
MTDLKIPFALDETEEIINPENAEKNHRYYCPACRDQVILREGKIKIAHFAHLDDNRCYQEKIIQKTAILLLRRAVLDWKSGKAHSPLVVRRCKICGTKVEQPLPEKVETACTEFKLPNGFVVDVALMVGAEAAAAIEIRVDHRVVGSRAGDPPIPFLDVEGNRIILNPRILVPLFDKFKPLLCQKCPDIYKRFNDKLSELASVFNVSLPKSYYRHSLCNCQSCRKMTIVFTWPGQENDEPPKSEPRPAAIRSRISRVNQLEYWANYCLHCNAFQSESYLRDPDGPLFDFHTGADTVQDFREDLMKLAAHADHIHLI